MVLTRDFGKRKNNKDRNEESSIGTKPLKFEILQSKNRNSIEGHLFMFEWHGNSGSQRHWFHPSVIPAPIPTSNN